MNSENVVDLRAALVDMRAQLTDQLAVVLRMEEMVSRMDEIVLSCNMEDQPAEDDLPPGLGDNNPLREKRSN